MKLDDLDVEHLWLPVTYSNMVAGNEWLDLPRKDGGAKPTPDFRTRREAAEAYVKDMQAGRGNRYMPRLKR